MIPSPKIERKFQAGNLVFSSSPNRTGDENNTILILTPFLSCMKEIMFKTTRTHVEMSRNSDVAVMIFYLLKGLREPCSSRSLM